MCIGGAEFVNTRILSFLFEKSFDVLAADLATSWDCSEA